jgi:hypothetical protein
VSFQCCSVWERSSSLLRTVPARFIMIIAGLAGAALYGLERAAEGLNTAAGLGAWFSGAAGIDLAAPSA